MNRKLLWIPLSALLLVTGATAVLAESGGVEGVTSAVGSAAVRVGGVLDDVLDGLVEDGTLTQEQADAVTDGVDTRREELRIEAEARREQLRTFLEDGALSAEELEQLPEDHPLRNLDEYLEDGALSQEELQGLRGFGFGFVFGGRGHGPWHPHGFGDGFPGPRLEFPGMPAPDSGGSGEDESGETEEEGSSTSL